MVMLAVLSPGLSLAFRTALDSVDRTQRRTDATQEIRTIFAVLTEDLQSAVLSPSTTTPASTTGTETETGLAPKAWFIGINGASGSDDQDTLYFTSRSHQLPAALVRQGLDLTPEDGLPQSDVAQISYLVEPSATGETASLLRGEAVPPTEEPTEILPYREISSRVLGLNLRYFDGTDWVDQWDSTDTEATATDSQGESTANRLPWAVEITVTLLEDGTPRLYSTVVPLYLSKVPAPEGTTGGATGGATGGTTTPSTPGGTPTPTGPGGTGGLR